MKDKTVIKILCASLVMIVIGGMITLAAAFSGGELSISQSRHGIFNFIKWSDKSIIVSNADSSYFTTEKEIISFQADIDIGSIEITRGSTFSISTDNIKKSDITVSEENGVYHFNVKQDDIQIIGNNDGGEIYVTLPDTVKTIDINQSLGEVEISEMNLTALTIDSAMGDVDLTGVTFEEGDITLSLGDFDFYGDFTKKFKLTNHMGDADIQLLKSNHEYNYSLKVNMGELIMNDHEHGSINSEHHQNNDKEATLDVKMDMGSLEVRNDSHD